MEKNLMNCSYAILASFLHLLQGFWTAMLMLLAFGVLLQEILARTQDDNLSDGSHTFEKSLYSYENFALPEEHIPYFLYNNQHIATACKQDPLCPYKVSMVFIYLLPRNFDFLYS